LLPLQDWLTVTLGLPVGIAVPPSFTTILWVLTVGGFPAAAWKAPSRKAKCVTFEASAAGGLPDCAWTAWSLTTKRVVAAVGGVIVALIAGAAGLDFPMPSFLALKLQLFLAGMLIAVDPGASRAQLWARLGAAMLLAAIPIGGEQDLLHFAIRELLVFGFFALVHLRSLGLIDWVSRLLGSRPFFWLGELSYGTYLIHLLILQPVAAAVIGQFGTGLGAAGRFALTGAVVIPATYVLAFVTYKLVELPGQRLGKAVISRVIGRNTTHALQTAPEKLAAP
jgi:peptidoglycan/LPS O-acetylase OafA/YrhL